MKAIDLKPRSEVELKQLLKEAKEKIFNFRFQQTLGQLENTSQLRMARRDVARIETVLRQKASNK